MSRVLSPPFRLVVVALLVPASAIGSPGQAAAQATPSSATASLDCQFPIGTAQTPPDYVTEIGGAVALQTRVSNRRAVQTASITDPATPHERYFAKSPLFVRTGGRSARIIVPRTQVGRVAVAWGNTTHRGIATRTFIVGPCSDTRPWIVFPGGFHVAEPACVKLIVRVSGHNHRVRMGVGSPCPGQRPPAEPSDS